MVVAGEASHPETQSPSQGRLLTAGDILIIQQHKGIEQDVVIAAWTLPDRDRGRDFPGVATPCALVWPLALMAPFHRDAASSSTGLDCLRDQAPALRAPPWLLRSRPSQTCRWHGSCPSECRGRTVAHEPSCWTLLSRVTRARRVRCWPAWGSGHGSSWRNYCVLRLRLVLTPLGSWMP